MCLSKSVLIYLIAVASFWGNGVQSAMSPLQDAYFDTFSVRLEEMADENAGKSDLHDESVEEISVPVKNLYAYPKPYWIGLSGMAWLWAAVFSCAFVFVFLVDVARLILRAYHNPARSRRRQARWMIMEYLQGRATMDEVLAALKCHLGLSQGTTLTGMADSIQGEYPELANVCRVIEMERFAGDGDVGHVDEFKRTLRAAFIAFVVGLTGCCVITESGRQWQEAVQQAERGKTRESLECFLLLAEEEASSPELSENISALLSVLPPEMGDGAEWSAAAWRYHAQMQRAVREPVLGWIQPEFLLPMVVPLAILAALAGMHGHRRMSLAMAMSCAIVLSLLVYLGSQRRCLLWQAVTSPQSIVRLTPDRESPTAFEFDQPEMVTIIEEVPQNGEYVFVQSSRGNGWVRKDCLLPFRE